MAMERLSSGPLRLHTCHFDPQGFSALSGCAITADADPDIAVGPLRGFALRPEAQEQPLEDATSLRTFVAREALALLASLGSAAAVDEAAAGQFRGCHVVVDPAERCLRVEDAVRLKEAVRIPLSLTEVAHIRQPEFGDILVLVPSAGGEVTEPGQQDAAALGVWILVPAASDEVVGKDMLLNLLDAMSTSGVVRSRLEESYDLSCDKLGSGGCVTVFRAWHRRKAGYSVAVKLAAESGSSADKALLKETYLLARAQGHPSIIHLRGLFRTEDAMGQPGSRWALALEVCAGGDLYMRVATHGQLEEPIAAKVVRQTLSAIAHVHSCGIVHRDVKSENILLDASGKAILVDFGVAALTSDESAMQVRCGSIGFVAPEVLNVQETYGCKVDVFGLGVTLYFLLSCKLPFSGSSPAQTLRRNYRCTISLATDFNHVSLPGKEFLLLLLKASQDKRPTASKALTHPWLMGQVRGHMPGMGSTHSQCRGEHQAQMEVREPQRPPQQQPSLSAGPQQPPQPQQPQEQQQHQFRRKWRTIDPEAQQECDQEEQQQRQLRRTWRSNDTEAQQDRKQDQLPHLQGTWERPHSYRSSDRPSHRSEASSAAVSSATTEDPRHVPTPPAYERIRGLAPRRLLFRRGSGECDGEESQGSKGRFTGVSSVLDPDIFSNTDNDLEEQEQELFAPSSSSSSRATQCRRSNGGSKQSTETPRSGIAAQPFEVQTTSNGQRCRFRLLGRLGAAAANAGGDEAATGASVAGSSFNSGTAQTINRLSFDLERDSTRSSRMGSHNSNGHKSAGGDFDSFTSEKDTVGSQYSIRNSFREALQNKAGLRKLKSDDSDTGSTCSQPHSARVPSQPLSSGAARYMRYKRMQSRTASTSSSQTGAASEGDRDTSSQRNTFAGRTSWLRGRHTPRDEQMMKTWTDSATERSTEEL